jgi:anti-sigma28 factor (negative regulator of flagellin synthesis)
MSQVNNIGGVSSIQQIVTSPVQKEIPAEATTPTRASDKLELSGNGGFLAALQSNQIRTDQVSSIRSQIAAGTYDADGTKLDGAVDKLLDEVNS